MPETKSKFDLHRVLAAIGMILTAVIAVGAFIWFFLDRQEKPKQNAEVVKVSTSSASTATTSAQEDETADWNLLTNTSVGYSLKYPPEWLLNGTASKPSCDDESVFLAPEQNLLGLCASGYAGLVYIARTNEGNDFNLQVSFYKPEDYQDFQKTDLVISGKTAVKITGISKVSNEVLDKRGTKEIHYIVDLGNRVLIISYNQSKETLDYSEVFEKIVSTFKFL
jgi:hypothetical protein